MTLGLVALVVAGIGLAAEPASAAFPGRNGEIGFARSLGSGRTEIYAVRPDGTHLRRLTHDGGWKSGPVYSPDGDWIAFTHERRVGSEYVDDIVVTDDDGRHRRRLAHGINPQWRAGGREIVFDRIGNPSRRYVMRRDGGHVRLLGRRSTFGNYSADGRRVVFSGGSGDNRGLFVMNTDGTGKRQLTRSPVYPYNPVDNFPHWHYFDVLPQFGPDGKRIVFVRQPAWVGYGSGDIYAIGVDGRHVHALTHPPSPHTSSFSEPKFSPDGRFVVFTQSDRTVYVARRDGTHRRVLVGGRAPDWQPLPGDG